jgi:aspartate kinase
VDGVFTADPRIVPDAKHIKKITYEEMLELAAGGAKVLMLRCVEYARRFKVPIHVRSSYSNKEGTLVTGSMEDPDVEQALITGVAHERSEAKITIVGVPDEPGAAGRIFETVAQSEINIDMIVQNVSTEGTGRTDISFTLPKADGPVAMTALDKIKEQIKFRSLLFDDHVGKVSLIGAGMRSHPGVAASFFACIGEAGVNIEMISTSEIRVSVVVAETQVQDAVRAAHDAFDLGTDEVEAVVYGGTGR